MLWAAGEVTGEGQREIDRFKKYVDFLEKDGINKGTIDGLRESIKRMEEFKSTEDARELVDGLRYVNKQNHATFLTRDPDDSTITVYRGWSSTQARYMNMDNSERGDVIEINDPPMASWTTDYGLAQDFYRVGGPGAVMTKAEIPVSKIILTDLVNTTNDSDQQEVLFKDVNNFKMEIIRNRNDYDGISYDPRGNF